MDDRPTDNLFLLPGLESLANEDTDETAVLADGTPREEAEDGALPGSLIPETLEKPPPHLVPAVVEALLLSADRPLTTHQIDEVLKNPGVALVTQALFDFQERLRRQAGGIRLVEVAKGWQLRTDIRTGPWVAAFRGAKPVRLSKAALETLAVVAYRQPVTRSEIESLRGVDSGGVLRMLCERGLASTSGRSDEPGRPLYYCTTNQFLELFGLRDLSDLPTLRDLRELKQDDPREMLGDGEGSEDLGEDQTPAPPSLVEVPKEASVMQFAPIAVALPESEGESESPPEVAAPAPEPDAPEAHVGPAMDEPPQA